MATGIPIAVDELIDTPTINTWARGYLRKTTGTAVNTTTAATDLLNGEFTLPAGAMSTDKIVRLTAWGNWKQNSGADRDIPHFQLLLGGTTLIDTNTVAVTNAAAGAARSGWKIQCEIQNLGSTNTQQAYFSGRLTYQSPTGAVGLGSFNVGEGIVATDPNLAIATYDGIAISGSDFTGVDTTSSCALVLNVLNAVSNANYETKLLGALCEII